MKGLKLKELRSQIKGVMQDRNKELIQQAVLQDKTYRELAKEFGMTGERVKQILRLYHIRLPLTKGTKKYDHWRSRLSKALKGKPKGLKNKNKVNYEL